MPRTNVVGTTRPPGSGVQRCAQAGEHEHRTDRTAGPAPATRLGCAAPILGVDPGITGGVAFLYSDHVFADDIPVVGGEVDVDTLVRRVREMRPRLAIIERAGAMPQQGVSSTFKYGVAYGALRTVVALCNIPYQLVTPAKWKNHFRLDPDKEKSRALAIQLWPGCGFFSRKRDHGRAEAALIARYGAETLAITADLVPR
jgi:crossover junction endodeoxyribonuclease RuvC